MTPVGADKRAIDGHMRVADGAGGQQYAAQPRHGGSKDTDTFVRIPMSRRAADPVVGGHLGPPGAVEKSAQHRHRLPIAAQRPPARSRAASDAVSYTAVLPTA